MFWLDILSKMRQLLRRLLGGLAAPSLTLCKPKSTEDEFKDHTTEIETTINKIFLTSLQSEF